MKIRDLTVFISVAELGSIQSAAESIGLTQSAVTRVIKRLEDDLGVELLDRRARPLHLTRDGERALIHAQGILKAIGDMENAFVGEREPTGQFRIGIAHAASSLTLGDGRLLGLGAFPKLSPKIITSWSSELITSLKNRTLDGAILITRVGAFELDGGRIIPVGQANVRVIGDQKNACRPMRLEEANAIGWAVNPNGCGYRRALVAALERINQPLNIVVETNSLDLQLSLAGKGHALTLMPHLPRVIDLNHHGACALDVASFEQTVDFVLAAAPGLAGFDPVIDALSAYLTKLMAVDT